MLIHLLITCIFASIMLHSHVSAANMLRNIDSMSELNTIGAQNSNKLIVLFTYAGTYEPFVELEKKLSEMAAGFRDVMFLKADIDKNRDFLEPLQIKTNPMFFFMKNGKTLESYSTMDENKIRNSVTKNGQGTAPDQSDDVEKKASTTEEVRDNSHEQEKFDKEDLDNEANRDKSRQKVNKVKEVRSENELEEEFGKSKGSLVVIDFFATWCGPCKYIAPIYETLAKENPDVVFLKVNGPECRSLLSGYNLRGYPSFVFVKDGQKLDSFSGADEEELRKLIQQYE